MYSKDSLPKDIAQLHALIQSKDALIETQTTIVGKLEKRIELLEETLRLERIRRYGRSSDQYADLNNRQAFLFDEAELDELTSELESECLNAQGETIEVPAYKRKVNRGKRLPLPDYLPRIRKEYTLPESELMGENGEQYIKIGEEVSEQLEIIPADVYVIQHVRFKYAVKGQEELGIKIAPKPAQIIEKGIATAGLLAHVAQAKYCHHLPLYRQEKIWSEHDVHLPRNTLSRWMIQVGEALTPLIDYQFENMKLHGHIHVDETPVTVLKDKNRPPDKKSLKGYMWVYVNNLGVIYDYRPSRSGQHAVAMLENFSGTVQSDAFSGYDWLNKAGRSIGCFAHARRKFMDVQKAAGKKRKNSVSNTAINLIKKLYQIERQIKDSGLNAKETEELRQEKSCKILDQLKGYLEEKIGTTPPNSLLGKAISYTLNNWSALSRYTEHGLADIDNNIAERAIKHFVIGRKNWLFSANSKGAKASANIYSLIESAKHYKLKVFEYLKYVFEELPKAKTPKQLEQLLPQYAIQHCPTTLPKAKPRSK